MLSGGMPSRRAVIVLSGGFLLCGARSWAQEPGRTYRLGVLVQPPRAAFEALFDELGRRGFREGDNLVVDPRGFGTRVSDLTEAARKLVASGPDALYGGGDEAGRALRDATANIPIALLADDLARAGLIGTLSRPASNITGVSIFAPELDGKRLEILTEIVAGTRRIAVLADPQTTARDQLQMLAAAGAARGLELSFFQAASVEEIVPAINAAKASNAQAINVLASALFNAQRDLIIEEVGRVRLPAMYQWPEYAKRGALACYGPRLESLYRQVARQLAKLLAGAKPADVPGEQPAQFELTINLKTAKALSVSVPGPILARADELIE